MSKSLSLPLTLFLPPSLPPSLPHFPLYLCSLNQALSSQPRNLDALYSQAQVYYALQDLTKSEEVFTKILNLSPNHKDARYYLGHVLFKAQRYGDAVATWRRLDGGYRDVATQLKLAEKYSK